MSEYVIETVGLEKRYGMGASSVYAVNGIDLKVKKGLHGFLGPNGAGKSTTIKMLVGALRITKGTATIMGHPAGSLKANACIGYIPEKPVFYQMPLDKYLIYMGRLGGLGRSDAKAQANYLIEFMELEEARRRDVNGFSAGMKQKAAIAQALMHEPDLLIMDEPTANLDPIGRASVLDKIKQLSRDKGISVFISSHILGEIEKLVDDITIINKGSMIVSDSLKALKKRYSGNHFILVCEDQPSILKHLKALGYLQKVWDEEDGIHVIAEEERRLRKDVQDILYREECVLETFRKIDVSLEDIFLKSVKADTPGAKTKEEEVPKVEQGPEEKEAPEEKEEVTEKAIEETPVAPVKDKAKPKPAQMPKTPTKAAPTEPEEEELPPPPTDEPLPPAHPKAKKGDISKKEKEEARKKRLAALEAERAKLMKEMDEDDEEMDASVQGTCEGGEAAKHAKCATRTDASHPSAKGHRDEEEVD